MGSTTYKIVHVIDSNFHDIVKSPVDKMLERKCVRWDAEGVGKIPHNEQEDIQETVKKSNESQRLFFEKNGHCFGGNLTRTQGIVNGTLHVSGDLPSHLKQTELFAQAGEFPVICRYSSEPSDPKLDFRSYHQPRGLSMKVFNFKGDMFEADKDFPTQDIEFNGTPALNLANAKTTKEILDLGLKYGYNTKEQDEKIE
ncbi:heme-dependent catalase [Fusarium langsethiae]|uniref:Heme-dependent catalase n=1 Tax=Fusarium langsethiae TaxID=179993 RepID=A0A0M9ERW4_FUSLA|nr:heme-dependent catalase [Fusarium langsethiae]GKU05896.1 unnamed protein product [Fusarium langsethiae]GKU21350.1 unnamed protein product [Fusarium langsethiae]